MVLIKKHLYYAANQKKLFKLLYYLFFSIFAHGFIEKK